MKLTDEDKKQIVKGFINVFARISNAEYQQRIWIKGEGPECDDFDDTVCDFFDQGDPILENYKELGITETQYELLMQFRKIFYEFVKKNDHPQEFIYNDEWKMIMEMAKAILHAFNSQKE